MSPVTHIAPAGAPVKMGWGKRAAFPRAGAWAIHIPTSSLGILFKVNGETVDFHYQDEKGESVLHIEKTTAEDGSTHERLTANNTVPASDVRIATYDEICASQSKRPGFAVFTAFDAAMMGYEVSESAVTAMTALQKKVLGYPLTEDEKAAAQIQEAEMQLDLMKRSRIAAHPEAKALEEQIEAERVAFVESVEKRRQEMFNKLASESK